MSQASTTEKMFVLLQHCLPQHLLSRLTGLLADSEIPWLKSALIKHFINYFNVDMSEAIEPNYQHYASFNQFFTRALIANARPTDTTEKGIASPADGAISEIGHIDQDKILQAKGQNYSLTKLLGGDTSLSQTFTDGDFATIYLSPKDYHRVHMPLDGKLIKTIYIPGKLFSVNQTTANNVSNLFARNERLVCIFDTPAGPMAMILVGAMIVAGIATVWAGQATPQTKHITTVDYSQPIALNKGDEMGRFKLGSTVILLFANGRIHWDDAMSATKALQVGQYTGQYTEHYK